MLSVYDFATTMDVTDRWERSSKQTWDLTKPLPLHDDSTSIISLLGSKPDVHYIYVCIKVSHQQVFQTHLNLCPELFISPVPH
jgi:hypothetical protein